MVSRVRFKVGDLVYCSYWSWYKRQYGQDPIAFITGVADHRGNHYLVEFASPELRGRRTFGEDKPVIHQSYLRYIENEEQNEKTKND